MSTWPFDLWLRFAVRRYGIAPNAFWDMSVCDFLALLHGELRQPLTRTSLGELMKSYPDEKPDERN